MPGFSVVYEDDVKFIDFANSNPRQGRSYGHFSMTITPEDFTRQSQQDTSKKDKRSAFIPTSRGHFVILAFAV